MVKDYSAFLSNWREHRSAAFKTRTRQLRLESQLLHVRPFSRRATQPILWGRVLQEDLIERVQRFWHPYLPCGPRSTNGMSRRFKHSRRTHDRQAAASWPAANY